MYLCSEIFFVCDLLCHIRIVGSVLQPGDRIIRSLLFDGGIRGDQPGIQAVQYTTQHTDFFRILVVQFFRYKGRNRIQGLEEHAAAA